MTQYDSCNSAQMIDRLDKSYLQKIESNCAKAGTNAMRLKHVIGGTDDGLVLGIYVNMCITVVAQVKGCISHRRESIIPYLEELTGKVVTGHDCANCSAGCTIKHASKIPEIEVSQSRIKDLFERLTHLALPLYADDSHSEAYRMLRTDMQMIQAAVTEMFFIEESILIPKILFEQKTIHVRR